MDKQFKQLRLKKQLKEQVQFLINSAYFFDLGHICEGRRMAVHLHILLVNAGKQNINLLTSIYGKEKVESIKLRTVYNSVPPLEIPSKRGHSLRKMIRDSEAHLSLDDNFQPRPILLLLEAGIEFYKWLTMPITTVNDRKASIDRRSLIKNLRNCDGGAHVDEDPLYCSKGAVIPGREQYFKFLEGREILEIDGKIISTCDSQLHMLRQFTHELLMSSDFLNLLDKEIAELVREYQIELEKFDVIDGFLGIVKKRNFLASKEKVDIQ